MVSPLAGIAYGAGSAIGGIASRAKDEAEKALNQAINISVGDIDVKQIIKYLLIFAFVCAIVIMLIQGVRGIMIWQDQLACGLANTGCDWFEGLGLENNCHDCIPEIMPSYDWMWDVEWWWRCLLYIFLAGVVLLIAWQFFLRIFNYLIRADYYLKKFEDWMFGSQIEGEAERQIETRL